MSLSDLQEALPRWVRLENRRDGDQVKERDVGAVHVIELNDLPTSPPDAVRVDVHFVLVAPTEGFPDHEDLVDTVCGALKDGEFVTMTAPDLSGGPSYITLGQWLGDQSLALMLIGAVELAGIAKAITPGALGIAGEQADQMAGAGFVMLGPSQCWAEAS